jgi:hypothetical protein
MNLGDLNISWLALGGVLALVASFWDKVKSFIRQMSKIMIVQVDLDCVTANDMMRYVRAHYKWMQFSTFNVKSIHKIRLDTGRSIWVPFKTPEAHGLYKGKHGWVWIDAHANSVSLRAIRGTVDFLQMVRDSNAFDNQTRGSVLSKRFYVQQVMGSEKGAWALGEAMARRKETGDSAASLESPSKGNDTMDSMGSKVYEDLDTSFVFDRSVYTHTNTSDPFKGLFYGAEALKEVENAHKWMGMGTWYAERSIPHRRGLAIHGPGGTGKSSYVKALAESLGIPVYQYFLNTLSDQEFIREWNRMTTPCIALLEDFDNVFHGREPQTEHKALTFDAVLNTISGVSSLNGVFLVVTTNHLEHVDPAMGVSQEGDGGMSTRPGRIDRVLYMGAADEDQRRRIITHILRDWPETIDDVVAKTGGMTPAQVQETCTQLAYERLAQ